MEVCGFGKSASGTAPQIAPDSPALRLLHTARRPGGDKRHWNLFFEGRFLLQLLTLQWDTMKQILITGGCGFIGRHVTEELLEHGYAVRVLDSLIDQVHGDAAAAIPRGVELIRADVRDKAAVGEALRGIDGVIHLAAEVGVGQSMYEIARYVGGNDLGTAVLLEAMIDTPVSRIVVASSMSVYGEGLYQASDGSSVGSVRRRGADIKAGRWDPVATDG